jgi:hypothetical protein
MLDLENRTIEELNNAIAMCSNGCCSSMQHALTFDLEYYQACQDCQLVLAEMMRRMQAMKVN